MRTGLPPEGRAYLPHITLARFSRGISGDASGFLAAHAALSGAAFPVTHFALYESILAGEGARCAFRAGRHGKDRPGGVH